MLEVYRFSKDGRPIAISAIAERTGISSGYLEELVRPLKTARLLRGRRGPRGGYQLARDATEISVYQVIEASIGPIGVTDCVVDPNRCERAGYCECRLLFWMVSLELRDSLQNLTLADMSDVRMLNSVRQRLVHLNGDAEQPGGGTEKTVGDVSVAQP
jgi:Rrf2 family protein